MVLFKKVVHITFLGSNLIAQDFVYPVRNQVFHILMNNDNDDLVMVIFFSSQDSIVSGCGVSHDEENIYYFVHF